MQTSISFQPDINIKALGIQIQMKEEAGAEAGTALLQANTDGPPIHLHPSQDEIFKVLQGELQVFKKDQWITLKAGESIFIPKKTPHSFKNNSSKTVLFEFHMTPRVRFTEMMKHMEELANQDKIKGQDFKSVMYLSKVLSAYPDVTQNVKPPQFVINTMAKAANLFLR